MIWERFFDEIIDKVEEEGIVIDIETRCELGLDIIEIDSGMTIQFIIE